ncbi:MAG: hypothetical protein J5858_16680, partial [Lentisphaeria bacterium]|nr:hypothetical protein [Lentisphaeria bacterium]
DYELRVRVHDSCSFFGCWFPRFLRIGAYFKPWSLKSSENLNVNACYRWKKGDFEAEKFFEFF